MAGDVRHEGAGEEVVAGPGLRAGARLADAVALAAVAGGIAAAFGAFTAESEPSWASVAVALVLAVLGAAAYDVVAQAVAGATLGKALFGVRVEGAGGTPCTWRAALVRTLWLPLDALLLPVTLGVMRGSALHQRLGDRRARTVVVRAAAVGHGRGKGQRPDRAPRLATGTAASLAAFAVAAVVAASVFARSQETAVCDRPQDAALRDSCLARLAVSLNKANLCERSATSRGRDDCYAHAAPRLGPTLCERVDAHDMRERCLMMSARDVSTCATLGDDMAREQCITRLASAARDARLCEPLKRMRETCLVSVGPPMKNDVCQEFTVPSAHDACYAQHGMCDQIVSPSVRDQCYLASDGGVDCAKIGSPVAQAACLTSVAGARHDPSLCDGIGLRPDNPARRKCYAASFEGGANALVCGRFTDPVTVQDCFFAAAKSGHDASLCSKVSDGARRAECLTQAKP